MRRARDSSFGRATGRDGTSMEEGSVARGLWCLLLELRDVVDRQGQQQPQRHSGRASFLKKSVYSGPSPAAQRPAHASIGTVSAMRRNRGTKPRLHRASPVVDTSVLALHLRRSPRRWQFPVPHFTRNVDCSAHVLAQSRLSGRKENPAPSAGSAAAGGPACPAQHAVYAPLRPRLWGSRIFPF